MCIFLPKLHCELNPIGLLWAQVKKIFATIVFDTFKKNMPLELASGRRICQHDPIMAAADISMDGGIQVRSYHQIFSYKSNNSALHAIRVIPSGSMVCGLT
ncbi:hypothetical protein BD769DRAFT_1529858 [Suillus cothurnatus]|nr:hypothetical protein BD769DRAFT_1529858 [Suillus cothurnatus]